MFIPDVPTMKLAGRDLLILAALLQSLPVAAQTKSEPAAQSDDIVVVGQARRDHDKQIRDFVRGMTSTRGTNPLPRFDAEKLCPQAVGLAPQYNKAITDRMRRVAMAARIKLAREDCRYPNALVLFAHDKAVMMELLRQRYPGLFSGPHGDPIKVPKEEGAALAWHVKGLVSREGAMLMPNEAGMLTQRTTAAPSRLQAMSRPVFLMSIVVIERRGVDGLTATQIADYAAMRAYTDASPARAGEAGAPTILTVLEAPMGGETPRSMTVWDLSFLRGLYASQPNSFAGAQRGGIGSYIKRQLGASGSGDQ